MLKESCVFSSKKCCLTMTNVLELTKLEKKRQMRICAWVQILCSLFFLGKNRKTVERNCIMKAFLILEDGHVFEGTSIGATDEIISEIVFNTSMTGYLEVLTDPSYAGQAVCMTYPLIGNYGVCLEDMEADRSWQSGFYCKRDCKETK